MTRRRVTGGWPETNQRHLAAAMDEVKARLRAVAGLDGAGAEEIRRAADARRQAAAAASPPPALVSTARALGLTPFEGELLLGAAAAELDAEVGRLCALAHGSPALTRFSFSLAQAVFDEAHWSALTPGRPLRALRVLEPGDGPLPSAPLVLDERVLHHLLGVGQLDERLQPWLLPPPTELVLAPGQEALAERIAGVWRGVGDPPVIQLCGTHPGDIRRVLALAARSAGRRLCSVSAEEVPTAPVERDGWLRLWQREMLLEGTGLAVEVAPGAAPACRAAALRAAERLVGIVVLAAEAAERLDRPYLVMEVPRPDPAEQSELWRRHLPAANGHAAVDRIVAHFDLGAADIARVARALPKRGEPDADVLWEACRRAARPEMNGLAHAIAPTASWDDLVLPPDALALVRTLAAHAPRRASVMRRWDSTGRGQGIVALFAGPSGTGKTLAAEVVAGELGLDLFRVDLSAVVSKWVGETEKHLRAILDAADRGSAVLLFDEADALFGKRSEVRDSHDRYANIEVGYLLQRLETYRGVAILTTNMKSSLDQAFLRRIRYVVQFPHPGPELREAIWRRAFPPGQPVAGLDFKELARLDLNGGSIRNIAVHASFDAAADGECVEVAHVRRATHVEYAKLERPLTRPEAAGIEG